MRPVELIRKKRDGHELTADEIRLLIDGYTQREVPDYQMSAWLMAVVLKGMTRAEIAALTDAMLRSGEVVDHSAVPVAKVDKHSTGGVGDKTSLILAPIVAAAGLAVPMISGRGLGHTGGTLDKLESIPGFRTDLPLERFRTMIAQLGVSMIGQTSEIAPADKLIYALRDVTGTVESPALICASIMSKKLAEGIDALVLDVKTGDGAFMKREQDAVHLAKLMVETGQLMGKKVVALITDMEQPLGYAIGNALEVAECVEILRGKRSDLSNDLRELSIELSAWMLLLGGKVTKLEDGRSLSEEMIASGKALAKFRDLVKAHGGDPASIDDIARLPQAKHTHAVTAARPGFLTRIACEELGICGIVLGGGRSRKEDIVDPAVGMILHKKVGSSVKSGETLCTVHYNDAQRFAEALPRISAAFSVGGTPPAGRKLIHQIIGSSESN